MVDEDRIKELEAELAKKNETIEELKSNLKTVTASQVVAESDFERQISKIAEEQEKTTAEREAQIKALEIKIKLREDKIEELEGLLDGNKGIKELQDKLKVLKSLNDKSKKEIDKLTSKNEKLLQEIEKYEAKQKGIKSVKELEALLDKKEGEIHELNMKLLDVKGLQTEIQGEQTEIIEAFDKQQARIKELEEIIATQKEEIAGLSTGLDAQKIQAYDNFVQQLQTELMQVKDQLMNSERLRGEQSTSIEKFELIIGQIESQIAQQQAMAAAPPPPPPVPVAPVQPMPPQPVQPRPFQPQPQVPPPMQAPPPPRIAPAPLGVQDPSKVQAVQLLDDILAKVNMGLTAQQLGDHMEAIRNKIVEIFQWHPTLFELAAFARRFKEMPPGPLDPENLARLINKVNDWKTRILT